MNTPTDKPTPAQLCELADSLVIRWIDNEDRLDKLEAARQLRKMAQLQSALSQREEELRRVTVEMEDWKKLATFRLDKIQQAEAERDRLAAQLQGEGTRLVQCRAQVESLEKQCQAMRECSNFLWTIICSAGGGDWSKESDDWQKAACLGREQYHAILSTTASRDYKIAREHQQALLKMAQLPPLTCIKCGDGRTPLYCLNCANEQLESALSQRQDQLRVALDQITELTRQRDVFFARVKALESAAAVPKPEEAK